MNKNETSTQLKKRIERIFEQYDARQEREALRMYKFVHDKSPASLKELKRFQKCFMNSMLKTEKRPLKNSIFELCFSQRSVDNILKKQIT
jgi:predicted ATPase with chaperone activity